MVAISWWDFNEFLKDKKQIGSVEKLGEVTAGSMCRSFRNVLDC